MDLKKSAYIGNALDRFQKNERVSSIQLALDLNVSPQLVSHMKLERRKMQQDVAKESILLYDNPEYIMDVLYEFSNGFTSPVLRGSKIEKNRLAFALHAKREITLVLHLIEGSELEMPISTLSTVEREAIAELADQLLTVRVVSDNFLKQLQVEYKVSTRDRLKGLIRKWMAVGWI